MSLTVSQMAANEASVDVTLGDGSTFTVRYFPNQITTKAIKQLDEGMDSINETLAGVIKSWDLLNDDGSMFSIDADSLAQLGVGIVWQIRMAIVKALRPNW